MRRARTLVRALRADAILVAIAILTPFAASAQREMLDGVWMQLSGDRPPVELTPVGQASAADYNPLLDDPDLRCQPASITNVIGIPDPPFEIRLFDDYVEINHEYMDVRRSVPVDGELNATDAPYTAPEYPHLGRSAGRYDGDTLVIQTENVEAGFVDTLRQMYPQSIQMRTEERYRADGDSLFVDISHSDPVNYLEPFTMSFEFFRVDFEILEFGCNPEAANYDDRL